MSDEEHTRASDGCGADVAAYVLGALSPSEAAAFEAHLASCAVCPEELASFQLVVDAMALTGGRQRAPRAVRRRVLRTVNQEARAARPWQSWFASFSRGAGARPALIASAALAVAAIVFGGVELAGSGSNARIYQAQVTGSGSAEVTLKGAHADLVVRHFAVPPKGHIYEVWLKRSGKPPVPANALFGVTASGDGDVHLPGQVRHGDQILVTAEPAGGSGAHPTTAPVMSVQLS